MSKINLYKLSITVIMNVLLISLFIGAFFFTYGSYIEKKVVKNQMQFLGNDITNLIKLGGPSVNDKCNKYFQNIVYPDLSHEDNASADNNKKVLMKAIIANLFFIVLVSISIFFIHKKSKKDFSMKKIFLQNFILLFFVGFTEFSFLTFFGSKYISINPNSVKLDIFKNIEKLVTSISSMPHDYQQNNGQTNNLVNKLANNLVNNLSSNLPTNLVTNLQANLEANLQNKLHIN